jgi:hypothetical protein
VYRPVEHQQVNKHPWGTLVPFSTANISKVQCLGIAIITAMGMDTLLGMAVMQGHGPIQNQKIALNQMTQLQDLQADIDPLHTRCLPSMTR